MLAQSLRAVERKSSLVRTLVTRATRANGASAPMKLNVKHLTARVTALGVLGMACVSSLNVAQCQAAVTRTLKSESGIGGGNGKKDDPVSRLIDQYGGSIGQVSFGGAVGFCAGMAVKSIGKIAAVAIGVVFVGAQVMGMLSSECAFRTFF
ncbi:hypothetical protein, variant [Aphanomyces invadans]|uniref:Uncharacterized protein n=1 Tax=Aphanomyces invadans TaxID=157072 RepID=A0A024UQ54_9STRA|nr:hypothetical protein, variant [Aphanomyces invadans]ETW08576.1 hypothetical protein, variant [Aphanomyces invadans]|eukprot:XP_008862381.1 hypothetical protein, variant [Aphanomyces invadans]